jgi:molybdopterin-dependent oxidoreductase alpha subunit
MSSASMQRSWRRVVPFGLAYQDKPRHSREMMRIAWDNRDSARYTWNILNHGVCDGCSLGPYGLKDNVLPGTHLCLTRLNLLRLNTMGAMQASDWSDIEKLRAMHNDELRKLGRVPYPLLLRKGAKAFERISWDDAIGTAASWLRETAPDRSGYFVTSRGITNETYYVAQKLARIHGTNNVDLCSRLCHAPSVTGLKSTIGYGAPTCQLSDFIGTDLLVIFGSDLANNQPVTTKYMAEAKKQGTRIVVVNPIREPGLDIYWIPSKPWSALFGTALMDDFHQVAVGGDIAFIEGALKALVAMGGVDRAFVEARTTGWDALEKHLAALDWKELEARSGLPRAEMESFAKHYAESKTAVFVWSMGITQHSHGADNVRAIVNLALARGMVGREKTGLMPIRGHSGVQGGGECGVDPQRFPGSVDITPASAERLAAVWEHPVPSTPGMFTGEMMEAVLRGEMDLLYLVGGNFRETMPDPHAMQQALRKLKYRIHQDIVLNSSSVMDPGEAALILPGQTRYEQRTGGTTTSTERRIRYTPEISGHPTVGEAKPEWEIPALIGAKAFGADHFRYHGTLAIRLEMEKAMPMYAGVSKLAAEGDWVQWGGAQLCADGFPNMPGGKARFSVISLPRNVIPPGMVQVSTRRGKQFNSIVFRARDPQLRNAARDSIIVSAGDARAAGIRAGDEVALVNALGRMEGRALLADLPSRHAIVYWPEGNVLLSRKYDPEAGIPDYNAYAKLEKR